jgi:hypothetical protein
VKRALILGTMVAFASCRAPSTERLWIAPPQHANDAAMILMIEIGGRIVSAGAIDLTTTSSHTAPLLEYAASSAPSDAAVVALLYRADLHALGLHPGALSSAAADAMNAIPLPTADAYRVSALHDAALGPWTPIADADAAVAAFRYVPDISFCANFDAEQIHLMTAPNPMFGDASGVALDQKTALVIGKNGTFLTARTTTSAAGTTELAVHFESWPMSTPHGTAYYARGGSVWFYGPNGALATGPPGEVPIASVPCPNQTRCANNAGPFCSFTWIDGPRTSTDALELYAITEARELWRLASDPMAGLTWTRLRENGGTPPNEWEGGVAWIAPNEAIAIGATPSMVTHVENGRATDEPLEDVVSFASTVAFIPGVGAFVGTAGGGLYRYDGTRWRAIRGTEYLSEVHVIAPIDGPRARGILFGGPSGLLAQYYPGLGFCKLMQLASNPIFGIVPLGRNYVLTQRGSQTASPSELTFLRRVD